MHCPRSLLCTNECPFLLSTLLKLLVTLNLVTLVNMTGNKCVHFDNDDGGASDVNDDDGGDGDDDEGALAGQMGP